MPGEDGQPREMETKVRGGTSCRYGSTEPPPTAGRAERAVSAGWAGPALAELVDPRHSVCGHDHIIRCGCVPGAHCTLSAGDSSLSLSLC